MTKCSKKAGTHVRSTAASADFNQAKRRKVCLNMLPYNWSFKSKCDCYPGNVVDSFVLRQRYVEEERGAWGGPPVDMPGLNSKTYVRTPQTLSCYDIRILAEHDSGSGALLIGLHYRYQAIMRSSIRMPQLKMGKWVEPLIFPHCISRILW